MKLKNQIVDLAVTACAFTSMITDHTVYYNTIDFSFYLFIYLLPSFTGYCLTEISSCVLGTSERCSILANRV